MSDSEEQVRAHEAIVSMFINGKSIPQIVSAISPYPPGGTRGYRDARETVERVIRGHLGGEAESQDSESSVSLTPITRDNPLPPDLVSRARKHGLSAAELQGILGRQDYRCSICTAELFLETAAIDHDHACHPGGVGCFRCVRGVLCTSCNTWLSYWLAPETLRRAADYLESSRAGRYG